MADADGGGSGCSVAFVLQLAASCVSSSMLTKIHEAMPGVQLYGGGRVALSAGEKKGGKWRHPAESPVGLW